MLIIWQEQGMRWRVRRELMSQGHKEGEAQRWGWFVHNLREGRLGKAEVLPTATCGPCFERGQ